MSKRVVAIIQARMNSTRLPGKVLRKILGKPLLFYLTDRIKKCLMIDEIIIATTETIRDDEIVNFCKQNNLKYYRGSENDVLSRFKEAASENNANIIVRICADSPLLDPNIVDQSISEFIDNKDKYDYLSNTLEQTYPLGMNVEVFSVESLNKAHQKAQSEHDREHVTPYIYRENNLFKIYKKHYKSNLYHYRLTVDHKEDFDLIEKIIKRLYPKKNDFTLEEIISFLNKNKNLLKLNQHIKQIQ